MCHIARVERCRAAHLLLHVRLLGNATRSCGL
jgi:hypothetical protein